MKTLLALIFCILLTSCLKTETSEYKQSVCSVDKKGFIFKAETNNKKHTISISNSRVIYKSTEMGKLTNNLETANSFTYIGTKHNGIFSYTSKDTPIPLELGIIDYYCWSGLKTKYRDKLSFTEAIK